MFPTVLLWPEKAIFADVILAQGKNCPRKGQWARPDFGYGRIEPEKEAVRHNFGDCRNVRSVYLSRGMRQMTHCSLNVIIK